MKDFSISAAGTAGFGLIARKPWLVLALALAYAVVNYAPLAAFLAAGFELPAPFTPGEDGHDAVEGMIEQFAKGPALLFGLGWIVWVVVGAIMLQTAIYRAVLRPRDGGFGYLRVGPDEGRQFLLAVLLIALFLPFILAFVFLGAFGAGLASLTPEAVSGPLKFLAVAAAALGALYVGVRLCLAAPMTFAEGKVRLFESWRVTAGRFWKLLGLLLFLVVLLIAVGLAMALAAALVLGAVALASGGMAPGGLEGFDWERFGRALGVQATSLADFANPVTVAAVMLDSLGNALGLIIFGAPLAAAYRDLAEGE